MNLPELKEDFYKRYSSSDNYLHFTSNGILCSLLGHCDIEGAPSLTCTLSMRVKMFARKLDGNMVKIQSSKENKCFVYIFDTPETLFRGKDRETARLIRALSTHKINGAQILYDSTIPEFLPQKETFSISLIQSLMKVSSIEYTPTQIATIASHYASAVPYIATASAKSGYCTFLATGMPEYYPLPLTGFKILSVHCTEQECDHSRYIKNAFHNIHRLYPHINSIADITPDMFDSIKNVTKDKTALRYMYHLINENARIEAVKTALKRCDTRILFREMNNSRKSMEKFWDVGSEHMFLARIAEKLDGVCAVRFWRNGIIAIIEEDYINQAMSMIRHSFENNIGYQPTFCVSEAF